MAEKPDSQSNHALMTFGDHLEELRRRLIFALLGVGVISGLTLWFGREIVLWLCQPLLESQRQLGLPRQTVNLSVGSGFLVYMKVSLIAALALGSPWVVYQIWRFIRPGLYTSERRLMVLIGPMSAAMTMLGVLFTYYLFLPAAISFLLMFSTNYPPIESGQASPPSLRTVTTFFNRINALVMPGASLPPTPRQTVASTQAAPTQPSESFRLPVTERDPDQPAEGQVWFNRSLSELRLHIDGQTRSLPLSAPSFMVPQIEINQYLNLVLTLGLIVVVSFQLPVVMTMTAAIGLLDPRWLARHRRYIVFGCFVVGVVTTPNQDLVSNVAFPLMLWGLFETGLLTMRLVYRRNRASDVDDPTE